MPIPLPDNKVIITVSPTGALVTRQMTPHLPEQPEEIATVAHACFNEGAAIVHIHARDESGRTTASVETFRSIHEKIRSRCNLIIQDSTGGGPNLTQEERIQCLQAGPEMASLNMGSLMRISGAYAGIPFSNLPEEIEAYVQRMRAAGIKPELEVYAHSMLRDVENLIRKGLIEKPYYINIVLGMKYQGACDATPRILNSILDMLPPGSIFNCTAVGSAQLPLTTMSMILGGCVRVGLEDNILYRKGELATNPQLVARAVRIARELGKEPATPDEARQWLGLRPTKNAAEQAPRA